MSSTSEICLRLKKVEDKVDDIETKVIEQGNNAVVITSDFKSLKNEFNSLKTDVLVTIKDHTDKTWKLMDKLVKVIISLVTVVCAISGFKIGAEIFQNIMK